MSIRENVRPLLRIFKKSWIGTLVTCNLITIFIITHNIRIREYILLRSIQFIFESHVTIIFAHWNKAHVLLLAGMIAAKYYARFLANLLFVDFWIHFAFFAALLDWRNVRECLIVEDVDTCGEVCAAFAMAGRWGRDNNLAVSVSRLAYTAITNVVVTALVTGIFLYLNYLMITCVNLVSNQRLILGIGAWYFRCLMKMIYGYICLLWIRYQRWWVAFAGYVAFDFNSSYEGLVFWGAFVSLVNLWKESRLCRLVILVVHGFRQFFN